jgi:hypothetical protein
MMRRATGAVLAASAVVLLAGAAPAMAARPDTVRCAGDGDACAATVAIGDGAKDRVVTVKLTDTDLSLAQVTAIGAVDDGYEISDTSFRRGGSEFRFTLDAKERNPERARIVLLFSADDAAEGPGTGLQGGWKLMRATFSVGVGMEVSVVGGGDGTSICTRDETVTTFTTASNDESRTLSYLAKGDGGCAFQLSWSQFKVRIKNPSGQLIGSGTLFFGQQYVDGDYVVRCGYGPWVGVSCSADDAPEGGPGAQIRK